MNKLTISVSAFFLVLTATCFNATSHAEPANLTLVTKQIKAYHDSGEYLKEIAAVANLAKKYILCRANENAKSKHPKKLAIVLDIDETSVSNYKYMIARHFLATKKQLHQEILQADAPAINPILSLYKDAIKHNITVFFVTGRPEMERDATAKNLKFAGFKQWGNIYLKPNDYKQPTIVPFKSSARKMIENSCYTIIANVGDQCSDLQGGYAEKSYKVPNPYYYLP